MVRVGDIVLFCLGRDDAPINGTKEHPALVTNVWSEDCINLMVFYDSSSTPISRTSVCHYDEDAQYPQSWSWKERE